MNWNKEINISKAYLPEDIQVGDLIDGNEIVEIKGLVDGKPTYASTFIVKLRKE